MRKKRAYKVKDVKDLVLAEVLEPGPSGAVTVRLDIGIRGEDQIQSLGVPSIVICGTITL